MYYRSGLFLSAGEVGVETMFDLGDADVQLSVGTITAGGGAASYGLGVFLPLSDRVELYAMTNGLTDGSIVTRIVVMGATIDLNSPGWSFDANVSKWYDEVGFLSEAFIQFGFRKELGGTGSARLFQNQPLFLLIP